jgi:hypothetical protein
MTSVEKTGCAASERSLFFCVPIPLPQGKGKGTWCARPELYGLFSDCRIETGLDALTVLYHASPQAGL